MDKQEFLEMSFSALTIGAAFAMISPLPPIMTLVVVSYSIFLHEYAHKAVAKLYGTHGDFRIWKEGFLFLLATSLLTAGKLIFAAPGSVFIEKKLRKKTAAYIALAGPLMNLALAIIILGATDRQLAILNYQVNMTLALFNLVPVADMDGEKVYRFSSKIWSLVFVAILALYVKYPF